MEIRMAQPLISPVKSMGAAASQDSGGQPGSESASACASVSLPTSMFTEVSHPSQDGMAISGPVSRADSAASAHGDATVHGGAAAPRKDSKGKERNDSKGRGAVRFACASDMAGMQADAPTGHRDSVGQGAAGRNVLHNAPLTNHSTP